MADKKAKERQLAEETIEAAGTAGETAAETAAVPASAAAETARQIMSFFVPPQSRNASILSILALLIPIGVWAYYKCAREPCQAEREKIAYFMNGNRKFCEH